MWILKILIWIAEIDLFYPRDIPRPDFILFWRIADFSPQKNLRPCVRPIPDFRVTLI